MPLLWPALWHWSWSYEHFSFNRQPRGYWRDTAGGRSLLALFQHVLFLLLWRVAASSSGTPSDAPFPMRTGTTSGTYPPVIFTSTPDGFPESFTSTTKSNFLGSFSSSPGGSFLMCLKHSLEGSFLLASPSRHDVSQHPCHSQGHRHNETPMRSEFQLCKQALFRICFILEYSARAKEMASLYTCYSCVF